MIHIERPSINEKKFREVHGYRTEVKDSVLIKKSLYFFWIFCIFKEILGIGSIDLYASDVRKIIDNFLKFNILRRLF